MSRGEAGRTFTSLGGSLHPLLPPSLISILHPPLRPVLFTPVTQRGHAVTPAGQPLHLKTCPRGTDSCSSTRWIFVPIFHIIHPRLPTPYPPRRSFISHLQLQLISYLAIFHPPPTSSPLLPLPPLALTSPCGALKSVQLLITR